MRRQIRYRRDLRDMISVASRRAYIAVMSKGSDADHPNDDLDGCIQRCSHNKT